MSTVLLAEPQATARWIGTRELEAAGFRVLTAAHRDDVERLIAEGPPDVVVLDRRLAGASGEVVRRLRESHGARRCLCVVLVLLATEEDRHLILAAGADWYLEKMALATTLPGLVLAALGREATAAEPLRSSPRALLALPVLFRHAGGEGTGETLNLSADGMFLTCPAPADPGRLLLLRFSLPGGRHRECFGRVMWTRRPGDDHFYPLGMGIRFVALEPEAQAMLAAAVEAARAAPAGGCRSLGIGDVGHYRTASSAPGASGSSITGASAGRSSG